MDMTDVEFNTAELATLLMMMDTYYKDKVPTPTEKKLMTKARIMYEAELEWDQAEGK